MAKCFCAFSSLSLPVLITGKRLGHILDHIPKLRQLTADRRLLFAPALDDLSGILRKGGGQRVRVSGLENTR